jgi:hypothetical protein
MKQKQLASLEAKESLRKYAALRAPVFADSEVQVDKVAGVIKNASIITIGPAKGWGFEIDATTLEQVATLINAAPKGVPARFKHPSLAANADGMVPDSLGTDVGYVRNARVVGNSVRGDVYLMDYAKALPGLGDVHTYLLLKAESDPSGFGLSAMIFFEPEAVADAGGNLTRLVARVFDVQAVDFVGTPAANPNGLLSAGNAPAQTSITKGTTTVNYDTKFKSALIANFGLAVGATDEEAKKMFDAMTEEQKAEVGAMAEEMTTMVKTPMAAKAAPAIKAEPIAPTVAQAALATQEAMLGAEGKRVAMLQQLGTTLSVGPEVVAQAIADGDDVIKARTRYLGHLQEKCKPVKDISGTVRVGDDKKLAMLNSAMPDAIILRVDGQQKFYSTDHLGRVIRDSDGKAKRREAHEEARRYASLNVLDIYRHYLVAIGAPQNEVFMLGRPQLCDLLSKRALNRRFAGLAQSSSDFDNILLDAQNKLLQAAYVEAPRTWPLWAKRGTAPDFKNINRPQMSEVPTLTSRTEGQPIAYVTLSDSKEVVALLEYTGGIKLTRKVLINDDTNAMADIPRKQGLAAARLEDDVAYAILTANAALADTGALFNSTAATTTGGHGNLVAGSGKVGTITVTTMAATEKLMLLQKGPKNAAYLGITPKFLLVPVALKVVAQQFVASTVDPSKSNQTPNPYNGKLEVIPNARFDAHSAVIWYLLADYRDGQTETVEVTFLADEPEPVLKQETDFDTDDVKYAVRHCVVAKALEFRGMVENPGA